MIVVCNSCKKNCQSAKSASWWGGTDPDTGGVGKKYRCQSCTRNLLKGAKVQTLDVRSGTIR